MTPRRQSGLRHLGFGFFALVCLSALGPGIGSAQAAGPADPSTTSGSADAGRLFEKYCFECHGDGAKKGSVSLDKMLANNPAPADHRAWEKSWKILRHEFMPPADAEQPSPAERKAITQWIEQKALGIDYQNPDPGRVTIRRLNRTEYEYTVTDLFGVDITSAQDYFSDTSGVETRLRDRLPPDDTAFGFDNNGDFLTLSPALLDKFFNIAEWVVDRVIVQNGPRPPQLDLARLGLKTVKTDDTKLVVQKGGFNVRHSGPHRIDVRFTAGNFAEIAGTFEVIITVDDREVSRDEVEIGGHRRHVYSAEVTLEPGPHSWTFSTRPIKTDAKGRLNVLEPRLRARLIGPIGIGVYEYPESHRRVFFQGEGPADPTQRRAYARAIVQRVADRAFRRPADHATVERLTEIVMRNENFERGVGQALAAILASPRFLFRAELQRRPDDPKSVHPIDELALASRLSYLLWLSLPDDELTQLAAAGKLRLNLDAQVNRLLADKKSERFFEDFPGQWLRTRNVLMTAISGVDGPLNPVRGSMKRETEMLFEDIARNDRDLIELVTADYTFADRKLAEYYGLPWPGKDGFQRISLPAESHRGGILTHGSFLVSTSNPNRTSPVKRGLYVLDSLWGTQPPPPPPAIPSLDDAKVGGATPKTVREQLAAHRENKSCAACHAHFDPVGIVLENYDLIGRWRDREKGEVIDPHEITVTGESLNGIDDLRKLFGARPDRLYRGITEKLMTYALGRSLEPFDAVTVDRITDSLVTDKGKFSTLLFGVVRSPAFQMRRGDDGADREAPRLALPEPPPPELRTGKKRRKIIDEPPPERTTPETPPVPPDKPPPSP